jgi:hypothetical protein
LAFFSTAVCPASHKRAAQAGIAILRDLASAAEHAGLDGGQIHAAELQKLAVMVEAAQIASLGQNGQRIDRSDPGNRAQQLIIRMVGQQFDGAVLDGIALRIKASTLRPASGGTCGWRLNPAHGQSCTEPLMSRKYLTTGETCSTLRPITGQAAVNEGVLVMAEIM